MNDKIRESKIQDAYISIDVSDDALSRLCHALQAVLESNGIECEAASSIPHVSIAYGKGECSMSRLREAIHRISNHSFEVRALDFEVFEGRHSGFDYLVLKLESNSDLEKVFDIARSSMPCRTFSGGMRSHISLVRFPKGALNQEFALNLVHEMNASQAAAFALGKCPVFSGTRVNVFDPNRSCRLSEAFSSTFIERSQNIKYEAV
jgi:hypothetical protein